MMGCAGYLHWGLNDDRFWGACGRDDANVLIYLLNEDFCKVSTGLASLRFAVQAR